MVMKDVKSLKWLWKNSKIQHFNIFLLILTNAMFSVLSVLFAMLVKQVVDGAIESDRTKLLTGCFSIVGVVILQFIFRILNKGLEEHISGKLEMSFRMVVFQSIFRKKYAKISTRHSGELMNTLSSDVTVVCEGITQILPSVFSALVRLLLAVIALLTIDVVFALVFLGMGVLVFLISTLMRAKIKFFHRKAQESRGRANAYMQENIENLLAVKVFANEDKVTDRADKLHVENFKIKMKRRNYSVLGHSLFHLIASAGYVFALIYGGVLIFNGQGLSYGDLSAILQLVNNVQMPFMALSMVFAKIFTMISSTERLIDIDEIEEEESIKAVNPQKLYKKLNTINFNKVGFAYDRNTVLSNFNAVIEKGKIYAIVGTSGIGKSTLFKLLLGVYPLSEGSIKIKTDGEEIDIANSTRSLFSYVPQGNMLFSGSIRENVTFINPDATEKQIKNALDISCSSEFINELPDGLETIIGEKGAGLSEGQLQRLALARALLSNAPIMLLDEATSALDEDTERNVLENLKNLKEVTVLIVTHKKAALEVCDKKINLEKKIKSV